MLNPILILPCFALAIVLMRWHTFDEPIECDITLYSTYAHELLKGRFLYSDLWEEKPPGIYLTWALAELFVNYGKKCIFFANVLASVLSLAGVYRAGTLLSGGKTTGLTAALFWVLISGDLGLEANQPNVEVFANAVFIWMFIGWLSVTPRNLNLGRILAIGFLGLCASLYKQYYVLIVFFLALAHLLQAQSKVERKTAFFQISLVGGVIGLGWTLMFLYFYLTGRFWIFCKTVIGYCLFLANTANFQYHASMFESLFRGLQLPNLFPNSTHFLLPLIILLLLGTAANARKSQRNWWIYAFLIPGLYVTVAISGKFFIHYYQIWLPFLSVGAAWTLEWLYQKRIPVLSVVLGVLTVGFVGFHEWKWYQLTPAQCSEVKYGDYYLYQDEGSKMINRLLLPGETFYEWDAYPEFYESSDRPLSVGNIQGVTLFHSALAPELILNVLSELEARKPELLILDTETAWAFDVQEIKNHPVSRYLSDHYIPFLTWGPRNRFDFWMRSGGALQRRIEERIQ